MEKKPLPLYPTMEKNIFRCIAQWRKTSSVVSNNRGKYLPLWDTMEEILRRCGYNAEDFSVLDPKILLCCIAGYSTPQKILLGCRIQRKKNPSVVGYNRKKIVSHPEIFLRCIPQRKKPLPLYPTTEQNLLCCINKTFSVVYHNGKKLFCCIPQQKKPLPLSLTTAKKT
jgi:hypothetical protein